MGFVKLCGAIAPKDGYFGELLCTEPSNHFGDHVAKGTDDIILKQWSRKEEQNERINSR